MPASAGSILAVRIGSWKRSLPRLRFSLVVRSRGLRVPFGSRRKGMSASFAGTFKLTIAPTCRSMNSRNWGGVVGSSSRIEILQKRLTESTATLTTMTAPLPCSANKCRLDARKFPRWFRKSDSHCAVYPRRATREGNRQPQEFLVDRYCRARFSVIWDLPSRDRSKGAPSTECLLSVPPGSSAAGPSATGLDACTPCRKLRQRWPTGQAVALGANVGQTWRSSGQPSGSLQQPQFRGPTHQGSTKTQYVQMPGAELRAAAGL